MTSLADQLRAAVYWDDMIKASATSPNDPAAKTVPKVISAMIECVMALEKMQVLEITDGCDECSTVWTREYEHKAPRLALTRLRETIAKGE